MDTLQSAIKPARKSTAAAAVKTLNLALQGGGAHGAFTWGVLDRLLEEERLSFEGVVATSAGAMNACVMAYGMAEGGRSGGQKALANFWRRISHAMAFSPPAAAVDFFTRVFSPYQFNPLGFNPLRHVLEETVDFAALAHDHCRIKLNVCATNVRSGKVKVFGNDEITADAILASACLPFLFQAVEIGGEAYWDGGYMGNPAIFPLIKNCNAPDILIVHVNPIHRPELPVSAMEIMNRVNEISFNSSLMREMQTIAFKTHLVERGMAKDLNLKRLHIHAILADDITARLDVASKMDAGWDFLVDLHAAGRDHAGKWLEDNFARIGKESTADIGEIYL
jgi:NTE family protein